MKTMTRSQGTAHAEHELAQLATRFQDWRHRRTTPSDSIPQSLWEQAVALTTVFSVSRVAQGHRRQLGDVEEAVHRPPPRSCCCRALHHSGLCGSGYPRGLARAHPWDGD